MTSDGTSAPHRVADALVSRSVTLLERGEGSLASELAWKAARAGDFLVAFIARSGELAPVFESLRGLVDDPNTKFRLVVPRDLVEAMEQHKCRFVAAKDGSGFVPVAQGLDGKWSRQVRLVKEKIPENPTDVASAVAHARTHAMLRQVLEKLDVIDKKLDQVLAHQRNESVAKVMSGVQAFRRIAAEPGDDASRVAQLANALQSLEEGQNTLLLDLHDRLKNEQVRPRWWEPSWSPSVGRARLLDRHEEDLQCMYGAARTIAAIHVMQDRPVAARDALRLLSVSLEPVRNRLEVLHEHSQYTAERRAFWFETFPLLVNGFEVVGEAGGLAFETSQAELLELRARGDVSWRKTIRAQSVIARILLARGVLLVGMTGSQDFKSLSRSAGLPRWPRLCIS